MSIINFFPDKIVTVFQKTLNCLKKWNNFAKFNCYLIVFKLQKSYNSIIVRNFENAYKRVQDRHLTENK